MSSDGAHLDGRGDRATGCRCNALVPGDARIEKPADGFDWSEGPVWRRTGGYWLFSAVPGRAIYRSQDGVGLTFNAQDALVDRSNRDLYFTDPPFGLSGLNSDPAKELPPNGVYRITPRGDLTLLTPERGCPNGIVFSPDEETLYVSNADSKRPIWMAYDVASEGGIARRVLFDATLLAQRGRTGAPDGMKVDRQANRRPGPGRWLW